MSAPDPALAPRAAAGYVVTTVAARAERWTLRFFPNGLRLDPETVAGTPVHVNRSDALARLDLVDFGLARRVLSVRKPTKRTFKLPPDAWDELKRWVGWETRLRIALKRRVGMGVPIGVLFLLTAIPIPGDAAAGIEGVPASPLNAALGVLLIAGAILARRRPRPWLFLLDSAWFALLAASLVYAVVRGATPFWLILVAFQLQLVWSGIAHFREFTSARRS